MMLEMKTCKSCKREITINRSNAIYCSRECYYKGRIKIYKNICLECNREFLAKPVYKNKKYCSQSCFRKSEDWRSQISNKVKGENNGMFGSKNYGELSPNWKGNKVGYFALHGWIKKNKPKSELCECCNKEKPHDLANISGEYKRDINDFEWLCRKCHMTKDGRLNSLKVYNNYFINNCVIVRDDKGRIAELIKKENKDKVIEDGGGFQSRFELTEGGSYGN